MTLPELVALAMEKTGARSTRTLAELLGVSHGAVALWQRLERYPDFEHAAELAKLAGLDPVSTAAAIRLASPEGAKHRGLLRQLARVAAGVYVTCALMLLMPGKAQAGQALAHGLARSADVTCYVLCAIARRMAELARMLLSQLTATTESGHEMCGMSQTGRENESLRDRPAPLANRWRRFSASSLVRLATRWSRAGLTRWRPDFAGAPAGFAMA